MYIVKPGSEPGSRKTFWGVFYFEKAKTVFPNIGEGVPKFSGMCDDWVSDDTLTSE